MNEDSDVLIDILQDNLDELKKLRKQTELFHTQLKNKVLANKRDLDFKTKTVKALAFLTTALAEVAKVAAGAAKAMKSSGNELAKANNELFKEITKHHVNKAKDIKDLIFDQDEADDSVFDYLLNYDDPTFWAKKVTGVEPTKLFAGLLKQLDVAREKALDQIDEFIDETAKKLRYVQDGRGLEKLA